MVTLEWLDAYLLGKMGAKKDFKEEWGWWRYQVGRKMFAATLRPGEKYASEYAGHDLLTLKCDPVWAEQLCEVHAGILPGFYMDKKNWISIDVHSAVPDDLVRELCDHSYAVVFGGLTKKLQQQILGEE